MRLVYLSDHETKTCTLVSGETLCRCDIGSRQPIIVDPTDEEESKAEDAM